MTAKKLRPPRSHRRRPWDCTHRGDWSCHRGRHNLHGLHGSSMGEGFLWPGSSLVNIGYDHPTMMICHEIHPNGHMIIWITTCAGMTIPQYGTWVGCGSFCFIKSDETTLKKSNLLFWAGWQSGLPRNSIVLKIRQFAHSKHLLYSLRWYLPAAIQKKTNIGTAGSGCPIWLHNIKEMWETKV